MDGTLFRKGYAGHSALVELFEGAGVCVKWVRGGVDVFPTTENFMEWIVEETFELKLDGR